MKFYCIANHKNSKETAGAKAPDDIAAIAAKMNMELIHFFTPKKKKSFRLMRFAAFFKGNQNWRTLCRTVEDGSYVVVQHPNQGIRVCAKYMDKLKKKHNVHFIGLIHDLNSLRTICVQGNEQSDQHNNYADDVVLKKCEYIICHNPSMYAYMSTHGFDSKSLVTLGLFDYLHDCKLVKARKKEKRIVVAGNLLQDKCEYLYKLIAQDDPGFVLELFGPNFSGNTDAAWINYHGSMAPDALPAKLEGSFGLVWDGTETDQCAGKAGEYIRYNNPHKCSLFLASNLPVIIWKHAALAEFVEKNGVGFTVENLNEIGSRIDSLSEEEYHQMLESTKTIGEKLRDGYFFSTAINEIKKMIQMEKKK